MAFAAAFALIIVLVIRPQEIWPFLNVLHLLDVLTGLATLGVIIDFATGKQKQPYTPQLPFLGAFLLVAFGITTMMVGKLGLTLVFQRGVIPAIFMLVVMYGAQTFAKLRAMLMMLVALMAFVAAVAVHQGSVEATCIELPRDEDGRLVSIEDGIPEGRACDTRFSCEKDGGKPGAEYACERLGMFKTVSTGRRVRWRGQLGDPNELSVYIGAVMPLLFALTGFKKKTLFTIMAAAMIAVGLYAVILSQSRGGQLVIGAVFGAYFVSRFGAKGVIGAIVLALPVVMLGGRDGLEADESSTERTELLYEGVSLIKNHPIRGVGVDQFAEHMWTGLTAHNSYVLAAAELGMPGFFCWAGLMWASVKIPLTIVRHPPKTMDPHLRPFAVALLVSFIGMAIGIFFLSFTYKQILFVWFGITGALYGIVRKDDPTFEVKIGKNDFIGVGAFVVLMIGFVFVYTRLKVG